MNKQEKKITVASAKFELKITSDEAWQYVHNPKGKDAKALRRYLSDLMQGICKQCLREHERKMLDCE